MWNPICEMPISPYRWDVVDHGKHLDGSGLTRILPAILILLGSLAAAPDSAVDVEMVSLTHGVQVDRSFRVAVVFQIRPGWHIYWDNPGEAGMPTTFTWTLPEGSLVLEKQTPVPLLHQEGDLDTFIHEGETIYLFRLQSGPAARDSLTLRLTTDWLECRDICRPGSAELVLTLPVLGEEIPNPESLPERIARAEAHFPQDNLPAGTRVKQKGSTVRMAWSIQERGSRIRQVQFFPRDEMIFDLGTPVTLRHRWHHDQLRFKLLEDRITEPERLYGIMVITLETPGGETTRQSIVNLSLNR